MGVITRGIANNILSGGTIDATDGLSGTVSASNITDSSISSVTAFPAAAGDFIQSTASDPSPATIGDVWYNNATYAFKVASATTVGTWAAGGSLNTTRFGLRGFGIQTAAIVAAGYGPGVPGTNLTASESYNGTSWTNTPSINTARRYVGSFGATQTAGVIAGGYTTDSVTNSESWNGSSWTATPTINTARSNLAGAGTQTTGLIFGGTIPSPPGITGSTESYNGTSWTTVPGSLNTARDGISGSGIQTAALAFGGASPSVTAASESYNGTSWTSTSSLNTARRTLGGAGTQTATVAFGGYTTAATAATELWNGTSWTTNPNSMATAREDLASAGTQASALAAGGYIGPAVSASTEEFTGPGSPVTKTLTTS